MARLRKRKKSSFCYEPLIETDTEPLIETDTETSETTTNESTPEQAQAQARLDQPRFEESCFRLLFCFKVLFYYKPLIENVTETSETTNESTPEQGQASELLENRSNSTVPPRFEESCFKLLFETSETASESTSEEPSELLEKTPNSTVPTSPRLDQSCSKEFCFKPIFESDASETASESTSEQPSELLALKSNSTVPIYIGEVNEVFHYSNQSASEEFCFKPIFESSETSETASESTSEQPSELPENTSNSTFPISPLSDQPCSEKEKEDIQTSPPCHLFGKFLELVKGCYSDSGSDEREFLHSMVHKLIGEAYSLLFQIEDSEKHAQSLRCYNKSAQATILRWLKEDSLDQKHDPSSSTEDLTLTESSDTEKDSLDQKHDPSSSAGDLFECSNTDDMSVESIDTLLSTSRVTDLVVHKLMQKVQVMQLEKSDRQDHIHDMEERLGDLQADKENTNAKIFALEKRLKFISTIAAEMKRQQGAHKEIVSSLSGNDGWSHTQMLL